MRCASWVIGILVVGACSVAWARPATEAECALAHGQFERTLLAKAAKASGRAARPAARAAARARKHKALLIRACLGRLTPEGASCAASAAVDCLSQDGNVAAPSSPAALDIRGLFALVSAVRTASEPRLPDDARWMTFLAACRDISSCAQGDTAQTMELSSRAMLVALDGARRAVNTPGVVELLRMSNKSRNDESNAFWRDANAAQLSALLQRFTASVWAMIATSPQGAIPKAAR